VPPLGRVIHQSRAAQGLREHDAVRPRLARHLRCVKVAGTIALLRGRVDGSAEIKLAAIAIHQGQVDSSSRDMWRHRHRRDEAAGEALEFGFFDPGMCRAQLGRVRVDNCVLVGDSPVALDHQQPHPTRELVTSQQ